AFAHGVAEALTQAREQQRKQQRRLTRRRRSRDIVDTAGARARRFGLAVGSASRARGAPRRELMRDDDDDDGRGEDPERGDDPALPLVGYRDAPKPVQQTARVAVLVEPEPLPNEAHDSFPRRELGHGIERAEGLDDTGELVDAERARFASRALVVLDQLDELAE